MLLCRQKLLLRTNRCWVGKRIILGQVVGEYVVQVNIVAHGLLWGVVKRKERVREWEGLPVESEMNIRVGIKRISRAEMFWMYWMNNFLTWFAGAKMGIWMPVFCKSIIRECVDREWWEKRGQLHVLTEVVWEKRLICCSLLHSSRNDVKCCISAIETDKQNFNLRLVAFDMIKKMTE